jgi:hypothetical protein
MTTLSEDLALAVDGGGCVTIEGITIAIGPIELQGRLIICVG